MFGRRYCIYDFLEMKYTSIALLIAVIIASANIQKNFFVIANEQQQAEQLGKKNQIKQRFKHTHTHTHTHSHTLNQTEKE